MHFSRYGRALGLFISVFLLIALTILVSSQTSKAHSGRSSTTSDAELLAANSSSEHLELIGHIGGSTLAVAVHGQYAYIGEGSQVTVLSIADPEAPVVVGTSAPLPGIVQGISVSGEYAYVAAEWGVHIFDISDPTAPAEVGSFATPGVAKDVTVDGQYAYIADSSDSLLILDITNLELPNLTGALALIGGRSDHMGVDVRDGIAFVAGGYGLKIIDVDDPASPILMGDYGSGGLDVVVTGTYAYSLGSSSLTIFDVSDPMWPFETGQVPYLYSPRALAVDGDYAYVADAGYGLYVIDISDYRNPVIIGTSSTPSLSGSHDVAVIPGYALTAGDRRGLHVYDVSDPTTPVESAHYDSRGRPMNLDVDGDLAYVTLGWDGLRIVDVENPEEPTEAGSFGYNGYDEFHAVDVSGNHAYVAAQYGLYVLDVSDPSAPTEVNSHWEGGNDVVAVDNYVYLARDDGGLTILDATDPTSLVATGHLHTQGTAASVAVSGNFAYLTLRYFDGATSGLMVVDISDPTTPRIAGTVEFEARAQQVALHGKHAYVAVSQGLRIIDVSRPDMPAMVGAYSISGVTWDVSVDGDFLAASGSYGLHLIDVADPTAPLEAGYSESPGGGNGIKMSGNLLYLADGNGGLLIARRTPTYSVSGRVTAQDGHPVRDVRVSTGYKQAATDTNGVYTLAGLLPGTHVIRAAKDDHAFTPQTQTATVPPNAQGIDFTATDSGSLQLLGHIGGSTYAVAVQGNTLFIGEGPRLTVLDISDPAAPVVRGKSLALPRVVKDIATRGDFAYVAAGEGYGQSQLHIFDIANLDAPRFVSTYDLPLHGEFGNTPGKITSLVVIEGYVLLTDQGFGLRVIDVSDPAVPVQVGVYETTTQVNDMAVADGVAFLATDTEDYVSDYGLVVINLANPYNPRLVSSYAVDQYTSLIAVAEGYAYVYGWSGGGPRLHVFDVSDSSKPVEVSMFPLLDQMKALAVNGGKVYGVANDYYLGARLDVIDVSDPAKPRLLNSHTSAGEAFDVAVSDSHAYVASSSGLHLVDTTNEGALRQMALLDTPGLVGNVSVDQPFAYLTDANYGLRIINIAEPAQPLEVGFYSMPGIDDVAVADDYAYAVGRGAGLKSIRVANPSLPIEVGSLDMAESPRRVVVAGEHAYMVDQEGSLRVVSIADPATPREEKHIEDVGWSLDVDASGRYLYITSGKDGLRIFDLSNPSDPVQLVVKDMPGREADVAVNGDFAYVLSGESGIHILDVSNPAAPKELGSFSTPVYGTQIAISGDYAYVGAGNSGLQVVDVSDPSAPRAAGLVSVRANGVTASGNHVFVAASTDGMHIVEANSPAAMQETGHYRTGPAKGVQVVNGLAYVSGMSAGLGIIDVSDPASPGWVGSLPTPGEAWDVAVSDSYAHIVGGYSDGLRCIDVSNPAKPVEVGYLDEQDGGVSVDVQGGYAYVAAERDGLRVVDVSNPAAPVSVAQLPTENRSVEVVVSDDYAYIADGRGGLRIADVANPLEPTLAVQIAAILDYPQVNDVAVNGELAFVAAYDHMDVIDVANLAAPKKLGSYWTFPRRLTDIAASGNFAFASNDQELYVIDVSEASAPKADGYYELPGWFATDVDSNDLVADGGMIYVANGAGGLFIFQHVPYSISGKVSTEDGAGLTGVLIRVGDTTAVSDANGRFEIPDLPAGTYTVTAELEGYVMTPRSQQVTLPPNAEDVEFIATGKVSVIYLPSIVGP